MRKIILGLVAVLSCGMIFAQVPDKAMFKIFDRAVSSAPAENLLLSPWGIQQCFSMLAEGTGTVSGREFTEVLGMDKNSLPELKLAVQSLERSKTVFNSVNAVFYNKQYTLQKKFIDHVLKNCRGRIFYVDFKRKAECLVLLNDIVQQATYGLCKDFFKASDLADDPALMVTNILWLNVKWATPFERSRTRKGSFAVPGKQPCQVMMMHDVRKIPYYNDGTVHAVTLPSHDPRFKIMLLMPLAENAPLSKVTELLTGKGLKHLIDQSSDLKKTELALPRLQLDDTVDLAVLLSGMGMKTTFAQARGDMRGIVKGQELYLARARQQVKLILNESGVKVAAAAVAVAKLTSAPPLNEQNNVFRADRPFVIMVFDAQTQAVILTGAVNRP